MLLSNLMVAVLGLDKSAQQLLLTQAKGYYTILDKAGSTSQARAGFEKYYQQFLQPSLSKDSLKFI